MRLLFRPSSITLQCDACRTRFDPMHGGVCPRCQRILCDDHLYGSWLRGLRRLVGARTVCASCIARERAGEAPLSP